MDLGNFSRQFAPPRAMSEADIADVLARFVKTSVLAEQSGFSGVQIHAAHGYLLSQFLSPLTNKRSDRWGGRTLAREAYFLEFAKDIAAVAAMPVMVTGGIRRLPVAEQVLATGIDMVGMGTALAINPAPPQPGPTHPPGRGTGMGARHAAGGHPGADLAVQALGAQPGVRTGVIKRSVRRGAAPRTAPRFQLAEISRASMACRAIASGVIPEHSRFLYLCRPQAGKIE